MIMFVFWFWLYLQSHSCCLEATDPFGLSVFILVDQVVFVVIVTNEPAFFVDALVAPPVELCGDFLANMTLTGNIIRSLSKKEISQYLSMLYRTQTTC